MPDGRINSGKFMHPRYQKICKPSSSATVVYVIEINRRRITRHEYSSRVFSFRTSIENISVLKTFWDALKGNSCWRFWEGRVWRCLNILVYNKKREEASRVDGKVAYLIVRRKVYKKRYDESALPPRSTTRVQF